MRFDDVARDAARAVRQQIEEHPLPEIEQPSGSPLRRVAVALGATVVVTGAVLGATGLLGGERTDSVDEPPTGVTATTAVPTTGATIPTIDAGEWYHFLPELMPESVPGLGPGSIEAITDHRGTLVAVGFETDAKNFTGRPLAWHSADRTTWQRVEIEADNAVLLDVASAGDLLVAVGSADRHGAVWTSEDGSNWTQVIATEGVFGRADANTFIVAVVAYHGGFVAVGQETLIEVADVIEGGYSDRDYARAVVWFSPDGVEWSRVEDPSFGGSGFTGMRDVATDGRSLVAVGGTNLSETRSLPKAWYSADGRAWQEAPIDDDSQFAFMTTVTSDGRFYFAGGSDLSTGIDTGAKWAGDGPSWERDGVIDPDPEPGSRATPSSYLVTPRGRILVGEVSGSLWFIEPSENHPFFPALWNEVPLDPPVQGALFGNAAWLGESLMVVGTRPGLADEPPQAAVWLWVPPEPTVIPTVDPPDPDGPLCSAVEIIDPNSELGDAVAGALFDQERERLGIGADNATVLIEGVADGGWVAVIGWFTRAADPITLWVGEPSGEGWAFTAVWSRFGGSAGEIIGALNAALPDAPEGLSCIDTSAFREQ